jgi:hypothetical protein
MARAVKIFKEHLTKKGYNVSLQGDRINISKGTAKKVVSKKTVRSIKVRTVPRA